MNPGSASISRLRRVWPAGAGSWRRRGDASVVVKIMYIPVRGHHPELLDLRDAMAFARRHPLKGGGVSDVYPLLPMSR